VLIRLENPLPPSDDLRAFWMAGLFFDGEAGSIYASSGDYCRMVPPDSWIIPFLNEGVERAAYPFIYPPLWAWIRHHVVTWTNFVASWQLCTH